MLEVTVFFDYYQSDSLVSSGLHQKFTFDPQFKRLSTSLFYKEDSLFHTIDYRYDSLGRFSQILYRGDYDLDYVFSYNGGTCLIGGPNNPEYKIEIQRYGDSIVSEIHDMEDQSATKVFTLFSYDPYPQWFTAYKEWIQIINGSEKRTEYYGYLNRLELTEESLDKVNFVLEYEPGDSVVYDLDGAPVFRKSYDYEEFYFFNRHYLRQLLYVAGDNLLRLCYFYEFKSDG